MVGLLTLVTNRVGSVTSTSFLVNFGDRRTVSGAMVLVSSGTLPGHRSMTIGLSAATTGQTTANQVIRKTAAIRIMVAPRFSETGMLYRARPAQTQKDEVCGGRNSSVCPAVLGSGVRRF